MADRMDEKARSVVTSIPDWTRLRAVLLFDLGKICHVCSVDANHYDGESLRNWGTRFGIMFFKKSEHSPPSGELVGFG